ncbi:MAG: GNAT family N-acetyltransferase [Euryarchaeota archaeon]|nr:GNAT family N-acetyltransferase [Euryarchaeota archaeon]
MPGLELVPLDSSKADGYWRAYVAGRTDLPTTNLVTHMERYLRLPPEEQQTYFALAENEKIVGTVRLGTSSLVEAKHAITFFSVIPEARAWLRDAILLATEPLIADGASVIHASYDDSYAEAFANVGFRERFSRMRMETALVKHEKPTVPMAHPEATDADDIADFLMAAYEGHMEQQFGMHVGTPEEWREYVTTIWKGESGTYLPLASWLTRDDRGLAGVSLATYWMGTPLLSELGVRKDRRGQGLARALLTATMNALVDLGYDRLALYATAGNDDATRLYEAMNFAQAGGRTINAMLEL